MVLTWLAKKEELRMSKLDEWVDNNMTLTSIIIMVVGLTLGYILF